LKSEKRLDTNEGLIIPAVAEARKKERRLPFVRVVDADADADADVNVDVVLAVVKGSLFVLLLLSLSLSLSIATILARRR